MTDTSLRGKKLLILGGAYQHRKLVSAAKALGVETYVTDYLPLEDSPAKQMADHGYMYNITDYDDLVALCQREQIDGAIAPYLDVTQLPCQELCSRMGFPCFGDRRQHEILTDKRQFKSFCEQHGVDVIPYYTEKDICSVCNTNVEYPIMIKPCDSRGSRGQTVCYTKKEALKAVEFAKKESRSGNIVIEKYMGTANDLQLVYMVVNGDPILVRVEDRYVGNPETGLDKLCIATIDASRYEQEFREKADEKIRGMIRNLGLYNSPVFIQAFWDNGIVRCYDPGIRLPGDDYDIAYKAATGIDMAQILVKFALTGEISSEVGKRIEQARIRMATAMILPGLKPGEISSIRGLDEIKNRPEFLEMSTAYREGDIVEASHNVKQRFGEFVIARETFAELKESVDWLFQTLQVLDENANNMLFAKFDTRQLNVYR